MKTAIEVQAPNTVEVPNGYYSIFLAGSIEMGNAELWQEKVIREMNDLPVVLMNPRRNDWNSSWKQSIEDEQFTTQVSWELNNLDDADFIILYLDPNTKSPISLLELGLHVNDNIFVCCPEGFWRKGNVDIVCKRNDIRVYETLDELIEVIRGVVKDCL